MKDKSCIWIPYNNTSYAMPSAVIFLNVNRFHSKWIKTCLSIALLVQI